MTENLPLFVESLSEAVIAVAQQVGGKKELAVMIRPDLDSEPDTAARWLLNALDDDHKTAFHAHHLIRTARIGREHGCHVLAAYLNDTAGYEPPRVAHIKSAKVRMAEKASKAWAEAARLQAEAEAMPDD